MRLIHFSPEPLPKLEDPMKLPPRFTPGKPQHGIWVSVESSRKDGWKWWCEAENFKLQNLTHATEFVLKPKSNVLWIRSAEGIKSFEQEYARPQTRRAGRRGYYDFEDDKGHYVSQYDGIDWARVMQKYAAIFIAPYQWSCRFDVMWYYCWDCASGVIWDTSIISEVKPAPEFARPNEKEPANG